MYMKILLLCVFGCSNSLITSFDLGGVISGNRMAGVPLGRSLGDGELDVEGICSQPGMACQNCTHAVTCVPLPVGWLKVPLEECSEGLTCNAHEGTCSEQPVPECDDSSQTYQHTCEQVGIFPDAYDCRKFHLCSPPDGLPDGRPADHRTALCPRHYGYNPQIAQCSVELTRGQCFERPVPDCTKVGQTDVLPSSPNHYYVCLLKNRSLYPQVFICPHGWFFWDGFCRPEPRFEENTGRNFQPAYPEVTEPMEVDQRNGFEHRYHSSEESATTSTDKATTTRMESFFSTEKSTTNAPDFFLADKFDLTNYESPDDVAPTFDEFVNSFESGSDFW